MWLTTATTDSIEPALQVRTYFNLEVDEDPADSAAAKRTSASQRLLSLMPALTGLRCDYVYRGRVCTASQLTALNQLQQSKHQRR